MSVSRSAPLPEEVELQKKLRIADRLKDRLADSEESLATLAAARGFIEDTRLRETPAGTRQGKAA